MAEHEYIRVPRSVARMGQGRDEGKRVYRMFGDFEDFREWYKTVTGKIEGGVVPLTWVPHYVGATRAAVYKRAKEGRLTAFVFQVEAKGLLHRVFDETAKNQYVLVPMEEVKTWAREMDERREAKARRGRG